MTPDMFYALIPITAILAVFGLPVALVFLGRWFKLREKELQLDLELRKTMGQAMEARVRRLESIILALDSDLRAKIGAGAMPRELMEPPPASQESSQPGPVQEVPSKTR